MSMWIAHVFIHAYWCSSKVVSLYSREILPYLRSSWRHHTILYLRLLVVAQWWRWSPLIMIKNLFRTFSRNPYGVHKFVICFMFVRFWNYSTCYYPIMLLAPYPFLLNFAFGFWLLTIQRLFVYSTFPFSFAFKLWVSYCALLFVCLMQSLTCIFWMEKCLMIFSLECKSELYM